MSTRILMASAMVCAVVGLTGMAAFSSSARQEQEPRDVADLKGKAFERGGLRAAAQVTGNVRHGMNPHGGRDASTLKFLTDNSRLIVIGEIRGGRGWLSEPGDTITTDYDVAVERVLKGPAKAGDHVTVSVLGGRVAFEGGSWAQIDTPGMMPPLKGQTFVLFLELSDRHPGPAQRAAARGPIYSPAFMSRGIYLIDHGIVNPRVYLSHPLAVAYRGKSESTLVNDILDIVDRTGRNEAIR